MSAPGAVTYTSTGGALGALCTTLILRTFPLGGEFSLGKTSGSICAKKSVAMIVENGRRIVTVARLSVE
jgi:hypothetical protein